MKKNLNNYLEQYIYLERYVNNGSPSGFSINTTSDKTSPKKGDKYFNMLEFEDNDATFIIGKTKDIFNRPFNYAHPDCINSPFLKKANVKPSKYIVMPTSSARTMLLSNTSNNDFIKLTYDKIIDRSPRFIFLKDALISLENTYKLQKAIDDEIMPKTFAILPETSAKVTILKNNDEEVSWGTIYREKNPYPNINGNKPYIPAFSLFSKDHKNKVNDPLITKLINLSNKTPKQYLLNILDITIDSFFALVINCGLFSEMHAQNCLYEIDENYNITRLILRDMQDIAKDTLIKPNDPFPYMTEEIEKYVEILEKRNFDSYELPKTKYRHQRDISYYYDFKLGEYLLKPLIKTVSNHYNINKKVFYSYIKEKVNSTYTPLLPKDYFPNEWYKIRKELYDFKNKSLDYYYIKKKNPKFR